MANIGEDLTRLAKLRDDGVLTEAEFQEQKARLLAGEAPGAGSEPAMPPAKKGKLGKGCLVVVGIIVLLIVIGAIAGGGEKAGNNSTASGTETAADTSAADASEAEAPSLSMDGYNRLKNGMTFDQVTAIVGQPSQEMSRNEIAGTETVMYMWEGSLGANMNAMFQNGKMIQKAQFGLR